MKTHELPILSNVTVIGCTRKISTTVCFLKLDGNLRPIKRPDKNFPNILMGVQNKKCHEHEL